MHQEQRNKECHCRELRNSNFWHNHVSAGKWHEKIQVTWEDSSDMRRFKRHKKIQATWEDSSDMRRFKRHEKIQVTWEDSSDMRRFKRHEKIQATWEDSSDMRRLKWHEKIEVTWEDSSDMRRFKWHEKIQATWEDSSDMRRLWVGKQLLTFRRTVVTSSSGLSSPRRIKHKQFFSKCFAVNCLPYGLLSNAKDRGSFWNW